MDRRPVPPGIPFPLLFVATLVACGGDGSPEAEATPASSSERTVAVAAVDVIPRDLSREIRVAGSIEPIRQIELASRTSGVATAVLVEEGDRVQAGQVLARLDVTEPRAELDRARVGLEEAERAYERAHELRDMELISESEYETARSAWRIAGSDVRLWEARVDFGEITAPTAGVVTAKRVETGGAVQDGGIVFHMADLSTLVVRVGISDVDAVHLSPGQTVQTTVDALPGDEWDAVIRRIFPTADPDSRLVTVEVAFTNSDGSELRPGLLARLRLDVDRRDQVPAIPNESLLASSPDDPFVFVIDDENRLERRPVVTGISRRDWTEIIDGLEPGERVVGSNPAVLSEGTLVQVARTLTHDSDSQ